MSADAEAVRVQLLRYEDAKTNPAVCGQFETMSLAEREHWLWWIQHWGLPGPLRKAFIDELDRALYENDRPRRDYLAALENDRRRMRELAGELVQLYRENYRAGVPPDDFRKELNGTDYIFRIPV